MEHSEKTFSSFKVGEVVEIAGRKYQVQSVNIQGEVLLKLLPEIVQINEGNK